MNPVIIIPSYWARPNQGVRQGKPGIYDHATPVDAEAPELEACLASLEQVRGVMRVVVLLVASPTDEHDSRRRVEQICANHRSLNPMIVGAPEAAVVQDRLNEIAPDMPGDSVSLRGYGAIKNMGLAIAAILGHDVAVFLDDDELALTPDFLVDAVYGLGQMTRQDLPVVAKTGFFLNRQDSPYATSGRPVAWYDRWWNKRPLFNDWMDHALDATRISRSNILTGGCFALHAEAFTRVGFDPYITRGEDLDYLFNLRMYGLDVWFDNQWYVAHRPPNTPSWAARFEQDVYRWFYQVEKLNTTNGKIDLRQVTPSSLMPYPGPWISSELPGRVAKTAFFRALFYPEHAVYWRIFTRGRREARAYAQEHAQSYLKFQTFWPQVLVQLWNEQGLAADLFSANDAAWQAERAARQLEQREAEAAEAEELLADARESTDAFSFTEEEVGVVAALSSLPQIEPPEGGSAIPALIPRAARRRNATELSADATVAMAYTDVEPEADGATTANDIEAFLSEARASAERDRMARGQAEINGMPSFDPDLPSDSAMSAEASRVDQLRDEDLEAALATIPVGDATQSLDDAAELLSANLPEDASLSDLLQAPDLGIDVEVPGFMREGEDEGATGPLPLNDDPDLAPETEAYELRVDPSPLPAFDLAAELNPSYDTGMFPAITPADPTVPSFLQRAPRPGVVSADPAAHADDAPEGDLASRS